MAEIISAICLRVKIILDLRNSLWYTDENSKRENLARIGQIFPFEKTLEKSHAANLHRQGVPKA
ncbi:hypothetical protein D7V86_09810 [bacterium D16-51]|nr:hypothetical protein D7V96_15025 [bacterium D16-59]RKI60137.1 hypothetical protein D7V86_09810 [bacterium D16-51]